MWLRGKRICAFLLALAIICTLVPAGAISAAAETFETEATESVQQEMNETAPEETEPVQEETEPAQETTEPTEETTEPAEEATEPEGENTEAEEEATEPSETPAEDEEVTQEAYSQADLVFDRIDEMEESPAKKNSSQSERTEAAIEIVLASDNYVEDSLERSGDAFSWWTDEGIRCMYVPRLQNIEKDLTPEKGINEVVNEPDLTKAAPTGKQVYLIGPYYGYDSSFTNQYKVEAGEVAAAIGDTDGYTLYSGTGATVDRVAQAVSNGAVVFFDSHGCTDYSAGDDCVSGATSSYLCLTVTTGLTQADYEVGAGYTGDGGVAINGATIANHMTKNSPGGIVWMAICLGMATDGMYKSLRQKGVEVVYGYSQSVTFGGEYRFEDTFWDTMKSGGTIAQAASAMKSRWGNWDCSTQIANYYGWGSNDTAATLAEARREYCAFPIVVSDYDTHPGKRTASQYASSGFFGADTVQTVNSTYKLFESSSSSLTWSYKNGVLTISGTGAMADQASADKWPWYQYRNSITSVVIGNGVTVLGDYAFYNYPNLTKVDLGGTLQNVGYGAFYYCKALKEVYIPSTVTTIEYGAFMECTAIQSVYYGSSSAYWSNLSNRPTAQFTHYSISSMNGHWTTKNVAATCDTAGYRCETCSCGYIRNKVTTQNALGHKYVRTTVKPTATSLGYTQYKCSRCGGWYRTNYTAPKITVSVDSNGKPVVSWKYTMNATVELYRATSKKGTYTKIWETDASQYTGIRDNGVTGGKTYYYKVIMVVTYGSSGQARTPFSNVVSATAKCAAPVISAQNASSGKPYISWAKVDGAKKYTVYRATSTNGKYSKLGTTSSLGYTDTKAKSGSIYYYKVIANGSSSKLNSVYSNVVSCGVKCAAPTIKVTLNTSGKPVISWNKVDGASSYELCKNGELLTYTYATSYTDTSVSPDEYASYSVRTICKNQSYNSTMSKAVGITGTCAKPAITGTVGTNGKPTISWNAVSGAVQYEVYRSTKSTKGYTLFTTVAGTSFVDTTVSAGKTFYYKVKAVSYHSKSVDSAYVKLTGKCAVPTISAQTAASGKPQISWEKIAGAKKYTVYRATSENGKYTKVGTTSSLSYTDAKAKFCTTYYYKVIANGSSSKYNSGYSAAVRAFAKCAAPTVKVTLNNEGKPVISWNKVDGAFSYEVRKNGSVMVYTYATSYTDINVQPGEYVAYSVRVICENQTYNSEVSKAVSCVGSCAAPAISIRMGSNNKPYITWPGVDGGSIYVVYRSTKKNSGYTKIGETYGWGYEDLTAKAGKTYYYKVVAMGPRRDYQSVMSNYVTIKSK